MRKIEDLSKIFITGTDTDAGKTTATALLLKALNHNGFRAIGYKPVASGAVIEAGEARNPDALTLLRYSDRKRELTYGEINPFFFEEPNAPHILSRELNCPISFKVMTQGANHLAQFADHLLIEGAGGWFTPLSDSATFADWVSENRYPVIVVVGLKLGAINHALLTFKAIENLGLPIIGWIANHLDSGYQESHQNYIDAITQLSQYPMIGEIPYEPDESERFRKSSFNLSLFESYP